MPCVQTTYDLFLIPLHYCCFELTEEKNKSDSHRNNNKHKTNTHKKQRRLKKKKCID